MKNLFKSIWLPITGYLLAVMVNLPHLVEVYNKMDATELPHWYPWVMFIIFDLGILILALRNEKWGAFVFACVVGILNLYAFWGPDTVPAGVVFAKWVHFIPGLLISGTPAFFVFWLSSLIAKDAETAETKDNTMETLRNEIEATRNEAERTLKQLEKQRKELEHLRKVAEYAPRSNETLRKTIANKRNKINSNGISKEDKQRMQEEIRAMLRAAGK